jgi:hypothetical protein
VAASTTSERPTVTTPQPVPSSAESQTGNDPYVEHPTPPSSSEAPEGTYRYRYDPPASRPYRYPYPKMGFQGNASKGSSSAGA